MNAKSLKFSHSEDGTTYYRLLLDGNSVLLVLVDETTLKISVADLAMGKVLETKGVASTVTEDGVKRVAGYSVKTYIFSRCSLMLARVYVPNFPSA